MKILEWAMGTGTTVVVAGMLGGAVNWLTRKAPWKDGLTQIAVGGICAFYLNPVALPVITPILGDIVATSDELTRLSGFVIGLGGVTVSGFFLDIWHRYRRDRPSGQSFSYPPIEEDEDA